MGKPVAISQFNRGGFVAVSYEAKAKGVRKGDGIGERGQKELEFFKDRPDAVMNEVRSAGPHPNMDGDEGVIKESDIKPAGVQDVALLVWVR